VCEVVSILFLYCSSPTCTDCTCRVVAMAVVVRGEGREGRGRGRAQRMIVVLFKSPAHTGLLSYVQRGGGGVGCGDWGPLPKDLKGEKVL